MATDTTSPPLSTPANRPISDTKERGPAENQGFQGKLPLWAPDGEISESHAKAVNTHIFRMRDELDDPSLRGGAYEVPHYGTGAYGNCFGPLALDQVLSFCHIMDERLEKHSEVMVAPSTCDYAECANTAMLFGAFLILKRGWSAQRVVEAHPDEADLFYTCSWGREPDQPPQLRLRDCWSALAMALRLNWISARALKDRCLGNLVCQQYRRIALSYDASWLIPGLVLVSADPISTVRDPRRITVAALSLPEGSITKSAGIDFCRPPSGDTLANEAIAEQGEGNSQEASTVSMNGPAFSTAEESRSTQGVSFRRGQKKPQSATSPSVSSRAWAQSVATLMETRVSRSRLMRGPSDGFGYAASSVHTVCKVYHQALPSNHDEVESPPKDFATWIKEQRVGLMVRVNFGNEPGLREHGGSYDSAVFREAGLDHLDIQFADTNDVIPRPRTVLRFFRAFQSRCVDERPAVLVHCKGGFGRSVMLCCLLMINVYDVPGREVLAWVRLARPGSITTLTQELFLCALSGRQALDGWLATGCCGCGMM